MKIGGLGSVKSGSNIKKRGSTSAAGSFADLLGISETQEPSAIDTVGATAPVSNLLSLQEVAEDQTNRKRLVEQGNDLLDSLDKLRQSILMGNVSMHILKNINQQLSLKKQYVNDPSLLAIIEDIELRASVELAKLETALVNQRAGRMDLLDDDII